MNLRKYIYAALLLPLVSMLSCQKDTVPTGVISVEFLSSDEKVSAKGELLTLKLKTEAAYTAELSLEPDTQWAEITSGATGEAGVANTVRIKFLANDTPDERRAELWVTVDGYKETCAIVLMQHAQGMSAEVEMNVALNTYMHDILKTDYLWNESYSKLSVDLTASYSDFLFTNLTRLGEENIEDGGYAGEHTVSPGQRYIYSYFMELNASGTKAYQVQDLGFGPIFSSVIDPTNNIVGLAIAYSRPGSPAYEKGMRRGDIIYKVNNTYLTTANYTAYMQELYYAPSGSYNLEFFRFMPKASGDGYELTPYTVTVATAAYIYNPVLLAATMGDASQNSKVGYLVLENFDLEGQEFLEAALNQFATEKITDLILDLRFNPGGAMAQSRYLASSIAGRAHDDDVFAKVTYNDKRTETWYFSRGHNSDVDPFGKGPDLGLKRLYVVTSYNTASASELIINSLRGIDFPVYTYGTKSEGKNVGMTTTNTTYQGRLFQFAPITFRLANAKGFGDYADGFEPDVVLNNLNNKYDDDLDNVFPYSFGDWTDAYFNVALAEAFKDITGTRATASSFSAAELSSADGTVLPTFTPLKSTPLSRPYGHYGSIIYTK